MQRRAFQKHVERADGVADAGLTTGHEAARLIAAREENGRRMRGVGRQAPCCTTATQSAPGAAQSERASAQARLTRIRTNCTVGLMRGMVKNATTGAERARQRLPAILADAAAGRTTVITRRGREIAAVVPAALARRPAPMALGSLAGTGRGLWSGRRTGSAARLRDEWSR